MRASRLLLAAAGAVTLASAVTWAQSGTVAAGPTLVVEGVPPIPASLAAEVRRYTESRAARLLDWHPTRREILISTRFGNAAQIHHVKMPGGARTQLTFFDEPVTTATYEPGDGHYFVFRRDVGGDEFWQLYRYDLQDGGTTLLTDGKRSQTTDVIWGRRGTQLAFTSTQRNGRDYDVYVMQPTDPKSARLLVEASGGARWSVLDWSSDDSQVIVQEYISINKSNLWLVDVGSGRKKALRPITEPVSYGDARFTTDGRGVFLTSDKDNEFLRLTYFDLTTGVLTPLTSDMPWDVELFDLSHDGRALAFVTNEAGVSKLYLMDTASRRYRPVTGVPLGEIDTLKWRKKVGELAFTVNSARSPSDVYSLTTADGKIVRWTESEMGGLIASQLSEPELIRWPSFDGREITGFYYRPAPRFSGKRPVIIQIHGGPEGQSRPVYLGRNNYYLNELGVAIVYPNVRGSTGYGKTFVALDNGMKREDSVKDIGALLDWIARRPELDASRVMVTGGSYGGYMTLASAVQFNDRLCCGVDVVGISNFNTFFKGTESYRRDLRRAEYGDERDPPMAAFFEKIAPLNNARQINQPLFVVAGGNDPRVPRAEAEQMIARVRQNGSPVWYLMAKDEGHGFAKKSNVDFQFYSTVTFVRTYLLAGSRQ